jgi:hypothetical protein
MGMNKFTCVVMISVLASACSLVPERSQKMSLTLTRESVRGLNLGGAEDQFCYAIHHWNVRRDQEYSLPLPRAECVNTPSSIGKVYGLKSVGDTVEFDSLLGQGQHFDLLAIDKVMIPSGDCSGVLSVSARPDPSGQQDVLLEAKIDGVQLEYFYPLLVAKGVRDVSPGLNSVALTALDEPDFDYKCERSDFGQPMVVAIDAPPGVGPGGSYQVGDMIEFKVTFDRPVEVDLPVTIGPGLRLVFGSTEVLATFTRQEAAPDTHVLYFTTPPLVAANEDQDGVEVLGFDFTFGNIESADYGNEADENFGPWSLPTVLMSGVSSPLVISSTNQDAFWYGPNPPYNQIEIWLHFDRALELDVTLGSPVLSLSNSASAIYSELSADNRSLKFIYTVSPGNGPTTDLDVLSYSANGSILTELISGTEIDVATILPTAGAAGSLSSNKSFRVDATGPFLMSSQAKPRAKLFQAANATVVVDLFNLPTQGANQSLLYSMQVKVVEKENHANVLVPEQVYTFGGSLYIAANAMSLAKDYVALIRITDEAGNQSPDQIVSSPWRRFNGGQWQEVLSLVGAPALRSGASVAYWLDTTPFPSEHKFIVFGGTDDSGVTALSDGAVFNASTSPMSWTALPNNAPTARYQHSTIVRDNKMYVVGGLTDTSTAATLIDVLDLTDMTWDTEGASSPANGFDLAGFTLSALGKHFGFGGIGAFMVDAGTGTVTVSSFNPTGIHSSDLGASVFVVGDKLCAWGGFDSTGGNIVRDTGACHSQSDPVTDPWTAMPTVGAPSSRLFASVAKISYSRALLFGGASDFGGSVNNEAFIYDSDANSGNGAWATVTASNALAARQGAFAASFDEPGVALEGVALVWGGSDPAISSFNNGAVYDPVANQWHPLSSTNAPTHGGNSNLPLIDEDAAVGFGGGMLFVFGGSDGVDSQAQAYLFKP